MWTQISSNKLILIAQLIAINKHTHSIFPIDARPKRSMQMYRPDVFKFGRFPALCMHRNKRVSELASNFR